VWNLDEGRHARPASWTVVDEIDADISLLCEARVPTGRVSAAHGKTIGRDCKHENEDNCHGRPWSTAILGREKPEEIHDARATRFGRPLDVPFLPSRPGSWIAASVPIDGLGSVTAVALYGLADEKSDSSVHRSLSDLEPIFEDRRYNERLLLGGDLNVFANARPDDPHRERHRLVLGRIGAFGLVDLFARDRQVRGQERPVVEDCACGERACGDHVWTFRSRRADLQHLRYQDDHVFASPVLADRLVSCETRDFEATSDHAPIVATFSR
jgi:exonuclease III